MLGTSVSLKDQDKRVFRLPSSAILSFAYTYYITVMDTPAAGLFAIKWKFCLGIQEVHVEITYSGITSDVKAYPLNTLCQSIPLYGLDSIATSEYLI